MYALIYGGAASGKSAYAETLLCALSKPGSMLYLATMDGEDPESQGRIQRHRRLRAGKGFETVERPRDLAGLALPRGGAVLLEDLGNLAANELFSGPWDPEGAAARIAAGLERAAHRAAHLVVVSNDLFGDGVCHSAETAAYLHLLSQLHQTISARCDRVVEVVCGLPVVWKGER